MKVFVAGATGVLGRRTVPRLVAAGHDVTGIARTPAKAAQLRAAGAQPVTVSLFDPDALSSAVVGHDAVINLATHIPTMTQAARKSSWDENERIRIEGSRNLVDAALHAGASVYVQESIAFLYGDHRADFVDADSTPMVDSRFTGSVQVAEANAARVTDAGERGVVLRFGIFWAAEGSHTQIFLSAARKGVVADPVAPDGYFPMIDADDAAAAVVAALDAPAGTYDIVDSDPRPRREVTRALARAVGRRRLTRPPAVASKTAPHLAWSQRVSNEKFRLATGWAPVTPTGPKIATKAAREAGIEPALGLVPRLLLWGLALTGLTLGVYAQFFPRAFYDDFPFNRQWVAMDGPYNEHLVRDFGAMNLALTFLTFAAIVLSSRTVARVAAGAWLVFSIPHALYHFRHLEHYDTADQIGNVVSLSAGTGLAIALLIATRKRTDAAASSVPAPEELVPSGA